MRTAFWQFSRGAASIHLLSQAGMRVLLGRISASTPCALAFAVDG